MTCALLTILLREASPKRGVATGLWIASHPGFARSHPRLTLQQLSTRLGP